MTDASIPDPRFSLRDLKRAGRLWHRLGQWYGARLGETYGPKPPEAWIEVIAKASDGEILGALETIRTRHPTYPPTLPEFEAAIRARRPRHEPIGTRAKPPHVRMTEAVLARFRLSAIQMAVPWSWIASTQEGMEQGVALIGVIVPQDPKDPETYPARRLMLADLEGMEEAA